MELDDSPFAAILSALPSLYIVDLHGQYLGPASAGKLAEAIRALRHASQYRLVSLCINDNRLGASGAAAVAEAVLLSGDESDACIATSRPLGAMRLLDLCWNQVGLAGAVAVAAALARARRPLIALDLENNDIGDAGAAAIAAAMATAPSLQVLRLGANRIGATGAEAFAEALKGGAKLEHLDLGRNNVGPRGAAHLAGALAAGSCLLSLRLPVNKLGDAGAKAFVGALGAPPSSGGAGLDTLDLGANQVRDAAATELARVLGKGLAPLRCLGLKYNSLTNAGVIALAEAVEGGRNRSLQNIELTGNTDCTADALNRLTTGLRRNSSSIVAYEPLSAVLELVSAGAYRVDLSEVSVGLAGSRRLAVALAGPRVRAREIVAANAGIGDAGTAAIADALVMRAAALEVLNLSWNLVGVNGAEALARLLRVPACDLQVLNLECNNLGDAGVVALAAALGGEEGGSVRSLRLASNNIAATGARALAAALQRGCPALAELDLSCNRLGVAGAVALAPALAEAGLQPLGALKLTVNRLGDAGAAALAEALVARATSRKGLAAAGGVGGDLEAASGTGAQERGNEGSSRSLTLHLGSNLIGDTGAVALAWAFGEAKSGLQMLALEHNKITGRGAAALRAALGRRRAYERAYERAYAAAEAAAPGPRSPRRSGATASISVAHNLLEGVDPTESELKADEAASAERSRAAGEVGSDLEAKRRRVL